MKDYDELPANEFTYIQASNKFPDSEGRLLDIMMVIILIQEKGKHKIADIKMYFEQKEELKGILLERKEYRFDDAVLARVKQYINTYTINDYERQLFKVLFRFIMELFRKLNVRNTMSSTIQKITDIEEKINNAKLTITYAQKAIGEKQGELEQLSSACERMK